MAEVLKEKSNKLFLPSDKEINDLANVVLSYKIKESIHITIDFVFNIEQTEI